MYSQSNIFQDSEPSQAARMHDELAPLVATCFLLLGKEPCGAITAPSLILNR
jgi:hypothetical protein